VCESRLPSFDVYLYLLQISFDIYRSLLIYNVILTYSLYRSGVCESRLPSFYIYFDTPQISFDIYRSLLTSTSLFYIYKSLLIYVPVCF